MKKTMVVFLAFLICACSGAVTAAPLKNVVMFVAPNVDESAFDQLQMSYRSKMTIWDIDTFEANGRVPFKPTGFYPGFGFNRNKVFPACPSDPYITLMSMVTGNKYRKGADVADLTIMEILADEREWEAITTDDVEAVPLVLEDFIAGETVNPFEPGIFILALYWETDAAILVDSVDRVLELVGGGLYANGQFTTANLLNSVVIVTRGWNDTGYPVTILAEGMASLRLSSNESMYGHGYIDTSEVWKTLNEAIYLLDPPKLRPGTVRLGLLPMTPRLLNDWLGGAGD